MLSLVVPTYNESKNLPTLLERLEPALRACGEEFEVIVVDDDSPDGTSDLGRSLQPRYPWLRVLTRRHQRDLSTAVLAGWFEARGDILGVIDGDLQHPPELLPKLVQRLRAGNSDMVIASRHTKGGGVSRWSAVRRIISWGATLLADFILPGTLSRVRDPMSGYFVLRRSVIVSSPLRPVGYKILLEVLAKGDYQRVEEIPYVFQERFQGGSKLTHRQTLQYLMHLASIAMDTGEARRVASYALVGCSGTAINIGAVALLRWLGVATRHGLPIAIALAVINNFFWNDRFTFPETRRRLPGIRRTLDRFIRFCWVVGFGALLNIGVVYVLVRHVAVRLEIAVPCGILVAAVSNFVINSRVTWKVWWDRNVHLKRQRVEQAPPVPADLTCNLCGGRQFIVMFRGERHRAARHPDIFCCTSLDHGDYTNIVRCVSCSLVMQAPADPQEEIEDSYRRVQDEVYLREEQGRVRTFDRLLDEIGEELHHASSARPESGSARLLDVGCYTGVFLDRANKRGWNVVGVEPSRWAAGHARGRGYTVLDGLLGDHDPDRTPSLAPESFDTITVWDVIEHFTDPLGEVRRLERLLKPGGLLALSTMDVESSFARLLGARWPWFMRMHLFYFSPDTLRAMLAKCGLEVVGVRRHRRIITVRYFLEKAAAANSPAAGLIRLVSKLPLLGRIHIPVNFGDIINVYAVKPAATAARS